MFRPGMPVGERAEPDGRLEPFLFAPNHRWGLCGASLPAAASCAAARRLFHENLTLHARKLAKFWRHNSHR